MTRLDDIEDRLATLEAAISRAPTPRFRGVWVDGEPYRVGDIVISDSSTWFAIEDVPPGVIPDVTGPDGSERGPWRLAARRGRPGKDAPDLEKRVRKLEQSL